jgi:hypothetical protein
MQHHLYILDHCILYDHTAKTPTTPCQQGTIKRKKKKKKRRKEEEEEEEEEEDGGRDGLTSLHCRSRQGSPEWRGRSAAPPATPAP